MWSCSHQLDLWQSLLESSGKSFVFDERHERRNSSLSFLFFLCHSVRMWYLELWQLSCHHEEGATNTSEKLTQILEIVEQLI